MYPPIEVPANLIPTVNLNVVMYRERRRSIRRVYQLGEFIKSETKEGMAIKPNIIYRWNPNTDEIESSLKSSRLFEELSRHTGLSQRDIAAKLKQKENILNWLLRNNVRDVHSVGKFMSEYYLNKEEVIDIVNKNLHPDQILK